MKKILLAATLLAAISCDIIENSGNGEIRFRFSPGFSSVTKSTSEIPDTNDFLLDVKSSSGNVVYSGRYGASPEAIRVPSGSYTVTVVSSEFSRPAFDSPQYGDEQCVMIPSNGVISVELLCRQMNCGIKLNIAPTFLTAYPNGLLYLKSADGKLQYAYREKRIAYFRPGAVSLALYDSGKETTLLTRTLMSQEILVLDVSASVASGSGNGSDGISIGIDTTRNWSGENFVIGGSDGSGAETESALSVAQAREKTGEKGVWVCGCIVGGDLTSSASGISFSAPFSSRTNFAIASRSSVTAKSSCMSIQLPDGKVREALNLVDHPDLLGRKVYVKGDIVAAYFGIPGIKNVTDFLIK